MKLLNTPSENISDKDSQYSNESSHDGAANKRRREALLKENAKRAREDRSSDDDSQDSSADVSEDELNGKVWKLEDRNCGFSWSNRDVGNKDTNTVSAFLI